jgi:hypothetical protein
VYPCRAIKPLIFLRGVIGQLRRLGAVAEEPNS